jgi:anti-sigma B factor antagonist
MGLQIRQREREGIAILDLDGRITVGEEATALRDRLREITAAGVRGALLNLQNVDYIDSTGLGAMVVCFTTLRKAGGTLKLLNLNRPREVLRQAYTFFADHCIQMHYGLEMPPLERLALLPPGSRAVIEATPQTEEQARELVEKLWVACGRD